MIEQNTPCIFPLNSDDPKDVALAEHYNQHPCLIKIIGLMAEAAKEIFVPFVRDENYNIAVSHRPENIYNTTLADSIEKGLPRKLLYQVYFYQNHINIMNNDLEGWNIKLMENQDQQEHIDLTPLKTSRHLRDDMRQMFKEDAPNPLNEQEFKTLFKAVFPKEEGEKPAFNYT